MVAVEVSARESPVALDADEPGALAASPVRAADDGAGEALPREVALAATWPDDTAEAAFLAEARERGEVPAPVKAREEIAEETDARPLPALDALVQRIPAEVRETLEDLFRAKFVRVTRVPRKALRS